MVAAGEGQATLETVALLPLLVAVVLAVAQLVAAGIAHALADHAAEAGAVALLERGHPRQAARDALPGWARSRVDVAVHGSAITVRVRPPSPIARLGSLLAATSTAHADGAAS